MGKSLAAGFVTAIMAAILVAMYYWVGAVIFLVVGFTLGILFGSIALIAITAWLYSL